LVTSDEGTLHGVGGVEASRAEPDEVAVKRRPGSGGDEEP
jgi:hypothetical protein